MAERPNKRAGRVTAETARRITGISIGPLGGIQWSDPGPSQREIVRNFILVLEDMRSMYQPVGQLAAHYMEGSAELVRDECTKALKQLGEDSFAVGPVRMIRSACRRYRDEIGAGKAENRYLNSEKFLYEVHGLAFGAFRTSIGYQVAVLAAHYDIDVEGELASILPEIDEDAP